MNIETALAKVNIFDYEPNRQSAARRLLKDFKEHEAVWFLEDEGIRFAYSFSHYKQTLTKVANPNWPIMPKENGFDIHAKNGPAIQFSSLLITRHALHRWEQRARQAFPSVNKFVDVNEIMATKSLNEGMMFDPNKQQLEIFYPFGDGAFIIEIMIMSIDDVTKFVDSISYAKQNCSLANYSYNKDKRRWVGEFIPRGGNVVVKTYLGWDELRQGGTFNSIDWYRSKFEWQQLPQDWNRKLRDMGVEV